MRALSYKFVPDRDNLDRLTTHYPDLAPIKEDLRRCYSMYVKQKAFNPIAPLGVSEKQKICMQAAYEQHPEGANLNWIPNLRVHGMKSCPMCGGLGAETLDHYLPQAHYPEYSVFSLNLLPSCGGCNTKRNDCNHPTTPHKTLHLYFDKKILNTLQPITKIQLLAGIPSFTPIYNREDFTEDEQLRIDEHFEKSISELIYFNFNTAEFETIKARLEPYTNTREIRQALMDEARIQSKSKNSWSHMLCSGLLALSDDELEEAISS